MQHIDYDMDDLYKRAAENYHLQKPDWDWISLKERISEESDDDVLVPVGIIKRKIIVAAAVLLFLLLSSTVIFYTHTRNTAGIVSKDVVIDPVSNYDNKSAANESTPITRDHSNRVAVTNIDQKNNYKGSKFRVIDNIQQKQSMVITIPEIDVDATENKVNEPVQDVSADEQLITDKYEKTPSDKNILVEKPGTEKKKVDQLTGLIPPDVISDQNNRKKIRRGFYFGLAAGADFSKVKSRPYGSGFNGGVIAGYSINSKLSLETGLFIVRKNYSSEGKYFKMDKVIGAMPAGMTIDDLESKSKLIEIPLKATYNVIHKSKADIFVSAGLSFYILTSEQNKYNVTVNGSHEKMTGDYKKDSYKFPATANLSFGYQKTVSKQIDLRIEPYLRIPLQGMGIGSLPVTSAGIQFGVIGHLK